MNPYGPYNIDYDINLDDQNGKPTDHIITVKVKDKMGNVTKKQFKVHFDPNYTGKSETNSGIDVPTISEQPADNIILDHPDNSGNQVNTNTIITQDNTLDLTLTHNAFAYDGDGKVVVTDGKNTLLKNGKLLKKRITLKKGNYYWAWNNAKIVKINGKSYYRVGKNRYVRAKKAVIAKANSVLDAEKLK